METGHLELRLRAPERFDASIGYWTGEHDGEVLRRALEANPDSPDVERRVDGGEVVLCGPPHRVLELARSLRSAGLE